MHGVVPPGSPYPLTPNPAMLLHQRVFIGAPFRLLGGGLRFGILFLTPKLLIFHTDYSGVSEHHLHQHQLACIDISVPPRLLVTHLSPSETFWLFHLLASKISAFICFCSKLLLAFQFPLLSLVLAFHQASLGEISQGQNVLTHQLGRLNPAFNDSFKYV